MALSEIEVLPGITAMLAASARLGAPLGHDFCNQFSDNRQTLGVIEKRLSSCGEAGFAWLFIIPDPKRVLKDLRALDILRETAGLMCLSFCPCGQHR